MKEKSWKPKTKTIAISVGIYAILTLFVIIICNNEIMSKWLKSIFSVLAPLIVGIAIAYLCAPILRLFETKLYKGIKNSKFRRALSMICTYLLIAIAITVVLIIIIPQLIGSIKGFAGNFMSYVDKSVTLINILIYRINQSSESGIIEQYINVDGLQTMVNNIINNAGGISSAISNYILPYTTSLAVASKNLIFGLFISIYALASKERIFAQCRRFFSAVMNEERYERFCDTVRFTNKTFSNYIQAQLLDALLVAVECAIIFSIAKMPYSVLLAFIIGVTNIIPVFGPFIGGIPAAFIVFITDPSKLILFVILLVLIQQVDGNFVLPKLVGTSTGMSSLGVLCAITVMGGYFGIIGMVLGVPFFVVIGALIEKLVVSKLQLRGMSLELSDYYISNDNEVISTNTPHEHLIVRLVHKIGNMFRGISKKISSLLKKDKQ